MRRVVAGSALLIAAVATAQDDTPYPQPASKKELQVQMVDDALAFGIRHAALNVDLVRLSLPDAVDGALPFERDGAKFWFDRGDVESLDAQIAPLSAHGVVVSLILLACQSGDAARDALLVHPDCVGRAPNGIAAFATVTARGRAQLRAAVAFLATRWSGVGAPHTVRPGSVRWRPRRTAIDVPPRPELIAVMSTVIPSGVDQHIPPPIRGSSSRRLAPLLLSRLPPVNLRCTSDSSSRRLSRP